MRQPRQITYDPACEDLARHFLSPNRTNEGDVRALAQLIQQCVENYLDYRDEEIRDRIRASAEDQS